MKSHAHFPGKHTAMASVFLAAIVLVACDQSKTAPPAPAREAAMPPTAEKVFVVFEGPWAIVDDPKDANSVLVLAPKLKTHNDLYVAASNDSTLAPGTYDLSVPAHGAATTGTLDPSFAQAKIDPKSLQHALDDKSGRYVVRLPKPEAYIADRRFLSRVGPSYPPDPSTEQNYVTFVSLRYSVASLNGFSLSGTPDTGTFNPLLLQLDTPTIRFAIEQPDGAPDPCHNHSRGAFRDTVKYLGLALYVDFPGDSADCRKTDPQIPRAANATDRPMSPVERLAGLLSGDPGNVQEANTVGPDTPATLGSIAGKQFVNSIRHLGMAIFFFHAVDGGCKAPILFLATTS